MAKKKPFFDYWNIQDAAAIRAVFIARTQATLDGKGAWCPASLTDSYATDKACPECGRAKIKAIGNRLIRPHLNQAVGPGIYVIDVGEILRAPGPRRLKFGMSERPIEERLEEHLQDTDHERCVVHYLFPVEATAPLTWQIPQTLEALLHAHVVASGADHFGYEYFVWSDELLERCIRFLNRPNLVDQIQDLIGLGEEAKAKSTQAGKI